MKLPHVKVSMSQDFLDALEAFAAEYETSASTVLLRGGKALLSRAGKWKCETRGKPSRGSKRLTKREEK